MATAVLRHHQLPDVYTCLLTTAPLTLRHLVAQDSSDDDYSLVVKIYMCKIKKLLYPYTEWTSTILYIIQLSQCQPDIHIIIDSHIGYA